MEYSPFTAPQSELEDANSEQLGFYVVGVYKFSVLFLSTMGVYSLYWFYMNWKRYGQEQGEDIWPVPRAMFNLFFVHSLFKKIQEKIGKEDYSYDWSYLSMATIYVILAITSNILDVMAWENIWAPNSSIVSFLIVPAMFYIILRAQKAINCAEGDPKGNSNSTLTLINYIWIIVGAFFWISSIFGLLIMIGAIGEA